LCTHALPGWSAIHHRYGRAEGTRASHCVVEYTRRQSGPRGKLHGHRRYPNWRDEAIYTSTICGTTATSGDLAQLADGLGTTLGASYLARAHYIDQTHFTNISQPVADVIAYANATTGMNSNAGKYFFANATTDGKTPVSSEAIAILKKIDGETDIFGKSYGFPAGTSGADALGDSRPFQTEPSVSPIVGPDYFNVLADNWVYNRGPIMNLINNPSYPSGHTTYGYTGALILAVFVPERYQQMIARAAEYGNDRILVGAHYAMDVFSVSM
jgi:hypothetical protein